jgi:phenylalanine-4-hydroxylase
MHQQLLLDSLPAHLKVFVRLQNYAMYTPRDQAVWRFLMQQLQRQLLVTAHPVYTKGLAQAGISTEYIPCLEEMNASLAPIGWGVVGVDGFIPPAVFMAFQARRILTIATSMRSVDQMLYTPAPDIVHEAAGHAPFLIDVDYAEFLQRFGQVGMKVLTRKQDQAVYEAIRQLSIIKGQVDASVCDINAAETRLQTAVDANQQLSEAALLARLHWWTVEYGLVGTLGDYKIYGAGLLSSLGENQHCLDDSKVSKRLLTLACLQHAYDITREQPQLYVTHSCRHLCQVLEDMAAGLAQSRGGLASVEAAIDSGTVATLLYGSGLQVSGLISEARCDVMGNLIYVSTRGPTQLSFADQQLPNHSAKVHAQGFSSPVGHVSDFKRCLSDYSIDELRAVGISLGEMVSIEFVSGISLQGRLVDITRRQQKNVLLSFSDCRVQNEAGEALFEPEWGVFDMAVGATIDSVAGGAADPGLYAQINTLESPSEQEQALAQGVARAACASVDGAVDGVLKDESVEASAEVHDVQGAYARIRYWREVAELVKPTTADVHGLVQHLLTSYSGEWLLMFEVYEWLLGGLDNRRQGGQADAVRSCLQAQLPQNQELAAVLLRAINTLEKRYELG